MRLLSIPGSAPFDPMECTVCGVTLRITDDDLYEPVDRQWGGHPEDGPHRPELIRPAVWKGHTGIWVTVCGPACTMHSKWPGEFATHTEAVDKALKRFLDHALSYVIACGFPVTPNE